MSVRDILEGYRDGKVSLSEAERMLRLDYLESIGSDVVFDSSRLLRKGIPEVVYARSKTPETVARIAESHSGGILIISKADGERLDAVQSAVPDAAIMRDCGIAVIGRIPEPSGRPVGIITAGTSDIPIAREAQVMAECMGRGCIVRYDVGIAGMHRVLEPMKAMIAADVASIVVCAGMEGALPTVVSSLSPVPVIGVPVSTGYGYGGNGEAALMCMLQSCSPGLTVVNVDNGIGAGATAALIAGQSI